MIKSISKRPSQAKKALPYLARSFLSSLNFSVKEPKNIRSKLLNAFPKSGQKQITHFPLQNFSSPPESAQTSPSSMTNSSELSKKNQFRGKNRKKYNLKKGDNINGFIVSEIEYFKEFNISSYKLEDEHTKAKYIHFDCEDENNGCAILFKTPPHDSTGLPHILEHLTLCGSRKYPIRDPFFNMIKRSLNSYMNAWTGSDFTMYPFSTTNVKDFQNLLAVYADACFFPLLRIHDFKQEGHRVEIQFTDQNQNGQLVEKGVVLNEMKGAMSDPEHIFLHNINENLFSNSCYRFNSGGDPKEIIKLEYSDVVNFHKKFYHPSNCTFISYGDMDFTEHLSLLQNNCLAEFSYQEIDSSIPFETRIKSPKDINKTFKPDLMRDIEKQAKIALVYLCNKSHDVYESFALSILSACLFEGSSSVFYKTLLESELGDNYSSGYGYDSSTQETTFSIGVDGTTADKLQLDLISKTISDTLAKLAQNGVDEKIFQSMLHQITFETKKTRDNFGLHLISSIIHPILYGVDPCVFFKINEFCDRLKKDFSAGIFQKLIQKHLIDNPHRIKLILRPDSGLTEKELEEEKSRLLLKEAQLSAEEKNLLISEGKALAENQKKEEDLSILPTLEVSDIDVHKTYEEGERTVLSCGIPVWWFDTHTNQISYLRIKSDIKSIPQKLKPFVPIFEEFLPNIGTKDYKYDEFSRKMLRYTGGISVETDTYSNSQDDKLHQESLLFAVPFLDQNIDKAFPLISEIFATPDFNDYQILSNLLRQKSVSKANNLPAESFRYGLSFSSGGVKSFSHAYEQFKSDMFLCSFAAELINSTKAGAVLDQLILDLTDIASHVFMKDRLSICIHADKKQFNSITMWLEMLFNNIDSENSRFGEKIDLKTDEVSEFSKKYYKHYFQTPMPVHNCVESISIPNHTEADFAPLAVLSHLLNYTYLHPELREKGGAYGAGTKMSESGTFSLFSYRSPDVSNSFQTFEKSIEWGSHLPNISPPSLLREAKLLTFSKLDRPINISEQGLLHFTRGQPYAALPRNQLRERILEVQTKQVANVCEQHIHQAMCNARTARVAFGERVYEQDQWTFCNPLVFFNK